MANVRLQKASLTSVWLLVQHPCISMHPVRASCDCAHWWCAQVLGKLACEDLCSWKYVTKNDFFIVYSSDGVTSGFNTPRVKYIPTLPSIASLWTMESYAHFRRAVCVFGPSPRWFHGVSWFCVVVASVVHLVNTFVTSTIKYITSTRHMNIISSNLTAAQS